MADEETPKGTDYSNAKKGKKGKEDLPEKHIQKVVTTEVIVQKKGVGRKIKDLFVAADFKSVMNYVAYDILIPAAKNMIVEGAARGTDRLIHGETRFRRTPSSMGRGITSRYTYQTPVNRERDYEDYRDPRTRPPGPSSYPRQGRPDFFLQSREEANIVLDEMYNILNVYDIVSVGDLNGLIGLPSSHTDEKWGWKDLRGVEVRDDRAGWLIDLPRPEPI